MKDLAAEGRTILVSSHLMNEMAVTADHLIVIGRGKLITEASTEDVTGLLPSSWGAHINAYLPEQAGTLITHTQEQSGDLLSPWQGYGVLCIWTVLALAVAPYLLERRDA